MAIKITHLYNKNFFSQVGTEYVCTGFMFGAPQMGSSMEEQLSKEGFMPGIDVTHAEQVDTAQYEWAGLAEAALVEGAETGVSPSVSPAGISIGGKGMSFGGTGY